MDNSWKPDFDLEEQMLSMQPDCYLTVETFQQNPRTLFRSNGENNEIPDPSLEAKLVTEARKEFGQVIGKRLSHKQIEEGDIEQETVAMLRQAGIYPSKEENLNSRKTLGTVSSGKKLLNGDTTFPILLDEEYFKLKPKTSPVSLEKIKMETSKISQDSKDSSFYEQFTTLYPLSENSCIDESSVLDYHELNGDHSSEVLNISSNSGSDRYSPPSIGLDGNQISKPMDFFTPKEIYMMKRPLKATDELIELPEFICGSCESGLVQAFLFKKKCLEAEQTLREKQNVLKNNVNLAASSGDEDENCDYRDLLIEPEEPPVSPLPEKSTGGTGSHNCLRCKVKFESYRNYQAHYREHHQEKDLCSLCGKFVPRYNLEKHQISHLKPKQRPFVCEECGKCFTLIENLRKHVRIHTGDHRYECEHCQKKFIHWNSKRCHLKTYHTREKDHECNLCKKTFAHRSNLIRHIRYHTGEMPHSCPHCPKKFNTTSELKNHLVTHTKEKNQICDVCSKAFGTRKALNTHLRTHSGERNYICPVCEKGFTQPHVLRTHLKIHHPRHPMPPPGTILSQKRIEVLEKLKEPGQQLQSL